MTLLQVMKDFLERASEREANQEDKISFVTKDVFDQLLMLQKSFVQSGSHPQEMVYYLKTIMDVLFFHTKRPSSINLFRDSSATAAGIVLLPPSTVVATPLIYGGVGGGVLADCVFLLITNIVKKSLRLYIERMN